MPISSKLNASALKTRTCNVCSSISSTPMSIDFIFAPTLSAHFLIVIENLTIKMRKDLSIILIFYPAISNDLSSHLHFCLLIFYREHKIKEISSAHAEYNFFLSSLFNLTLDAASEDSTHSTYPTLPERVHLENFRLLSFTSFSKVQMQLLSCIRFNFTLPSSFEYHPILASSSIVGRLLTATAFADSQCYQVKNNSLVDCLIF